MSYIIYICIKLSKQQRYVTISFIYMENLPVTVTVKGTFLIACIVIACNIGLGQAITILVLYNPNIHSKESRTWV